MGQDEENYVPPQDLIAGWCLPQVEEAGEIGRVSGSTQMEGPSVEAAF